MRMFTRSAIVTLATIPVSVNALDFSALNVSIDPRLETGATFYEFEQSGNVVQRIDEDFGVPEVSGRSGFKVSDFMPFVGGGATIFVNRFFLDLSAQYTGTGNDVGRATDTEFEDFTDDPEFGDIAQLVRVTNNDAEFDRLDYAFSVGYAVSEHIAFFAGYKRSEADFTLQRTIDSKSFFCGAVPGGGCDEPQATFTDVDEVEFTHDGPFVGANFLTGTLSQGFLTGALSGNIAVAFLDGDIEEDIQNTTVVASDDPDLPVGPAPGFDKKEELSGDTVGLSAAITWRGLTPIDGLTYSLGINGYDYSFSGEEALDFSETVVNFKVGIAYTFGI